MRRRSSRVQSVGVAFSAPNGLCVCLTYLWTDNLPARADAPPPCTQGHFELVKWLVRTRDGANVRVQDIVGWEPLHFAARGGHLQIFRWLTTQQYTHVDLCCAAVGGWQPIHVAVFGGHVDVARWLTVQQEVKPLAGVLQARADLGWTPLHAAAFAGALSTTIWLADNGVDVNAKAEDGSTPLSLAEQFAHKQVLTRLKSFGALDQGAPSEPSTRPNELLMMTIPRRNLQYSRAAPLKDESKGMAAAIALAVRDAFFSPAPQAEPPSAEEAASIVLQSAWRGVQAVRVLTAKRFLVRLMALTVNVEHRKARVIQASYREYTSKLRQLALLSKSEQLALVLKGQAARQVRGALDKLHMATELKAELRILMEKGRVYPLTNGGELVSWGVRYAYVGESGGRSGLCYQHVDTRTMVPYGKVKGIAWDTIAKVEVLLDNTVCIESTAGVKHNFRPVRCRDPPTVAWFWALRLCQLAELLGFRYDGFVADAARDENEKLTRPEPWVAALQDTGATGEQRRGAAGGAQALDEYADVAVEAERRQQWIRYFVKKGNYQKAKEIGWDGADPPDPRKAERPAVAPAARAPKDERAPLLPGSVSGAQIKVDAPAAPEPAGAKADRIAAEGAENKEPVQTPPAIVTRI